MKKVTNLKEFKNTMPYASEVFGVYQPLLGWKSKRISGRFEKGFIKDKLSLLNKVFAYYKGEYKVDFDENTHFNKINKIDISKIGGMSQDLNTILSKEIKRTLPPEEKMNNKKWEEFINTESLNRILNTTVKNNLTEWMKNGQIPQSSLLDIARIPDVKIQALKEKINRESIVAGILQDLVTNEQFNLLRHIFYKPKFDILSVMQVVNCIDPFEYIDPKKDLDRVCLSPIGIVHLFRQYFYEFDTFLGIPVGHIWISPGSTVELIEISTRNTITEKAIELQTERVLKAETSTTEEDEISEAVKEDNKNDIKFGANVSAKESWIWGSASESSSFDMNTTQQTAREQSHKHMRQQSEKLSTEIRENYKSTFRTVTEYTDTTSKRYVLTNTTGNLINYELRRKMRQVGVQVQDIGTYLCWQSYVDEPGRELGIANLVHLATSPDLDKIPHPEKIVPKKPFTEKINIQIPFVGIDTEDNDISYTNGTETEVDWIFDDTEHIEIRFPQKVVCKEIEYYLDDVTLQPQGAEVKPSIGEFEVNKNTNEANFTVYLDYVHFHGQNTINIEATLYWKPNQDENAIEKENEARLKEFTERVESAYKKEFVTAARERIKFASNIQSRKYEDLREEERIVVYRKLIQELLAPENKIPQPDYRTRHVVSELINSVFDVDKMLYFVAPEWWKPREHYGQSFGIMKPTGEIGEDGMPKMQPDLANTITNENIVSWGGINEMREDNYYITDESKPAKLGSSLGWLCQLDGDNMRNAFLNAPWVKAVIPIRPGKEKAALNWLKQIEGFDGITDNDIYTGKELDLRGKSMLEVLEILADKVQMKHENALKTSDIPDPDDPTNADNTVTTTPVDKVYEHGFYPLQGGFKVKVDEEFQIFDQWIEVLPTDQVVAVEVKYDPKTGKQV